MYYELLGECEESGGECQTMENLVMEHLSQEGARDPITEYAVFQVSI